MKFMIKGWTKKDSVSVVLISLSAILLAFNYYLFIIPNGFAPAGLNGIATMIQYKTGFSIGYMSLLINIPLCIFAYFLYDKKFALNSLIFSLVYSFAFLLLGNTELDNFKYNAAGHDTIYPVILSSVISGFIYGVCFRNSGSTGGTDIVSKYISYKKPEMNFFWINFTINTVVAAASFFVYSKVGADGNMIYDYKPVCLCVMYCFASSFIGSYIIKGTKTASKFTVITTHADEIATEIKEKLRHSSTRVSAIGSFSNNERALLICVINRHQIVEFNEILMKYDNTFSFSETVNETYGNFKKIK